MNSIAICVGNTEIYWSSIIIVLGIAAGFCLSYAIFTAHRGKGSTMFAFLFFSLISGIFISRFVHFYTHQEQYDGFLKAMTDYSGGSYFLPGVLGGLWIAAKLMKIFDYTDSESDLLDAAAPGMALTFAFIRLSALFTGACRGKIAITNKNLQHLPFASAVSSGSTEYRFASFFFMAILLALSSVLILVFYYRHHRDEMIPGCPETGHTAKLFLLLYAIIELVLDSTRNDSTFPYFAIVKGLNKYASFISLTQLFAAVSILYIFIFYCKRSVSYEGGKPKHWICSVVYALSLVGVGVSEYMVQRHGDLYKIYYSTMTVSAVFMLLSVISVYLLCRMRVSETVREDDFDLPEEYEQ